MTFHDVLTDYYRRIVGCTAEDADCLATHIMATLQRGQGDGVGCIMGAIESTMPPSASNALTASDGILSHDKEARYG